MNEDMEKSELTGWERFLYWFMIPTVFSVVLVLVLLSLFDFNVSDQILKAVNKVPIVKNWVPDVKGEEKNEAEITSEQKVDTLNIELVDLKNQLAQKEEELRQNDSHAAAQEDSIKQLEAKIAELELVQEQQAISEESYKKRIRDISSTYAKMTPSKAAPIIENLTRMEQVLVLSEMKQEDRVKILEKMNPKKAAEASIALKDIIVSRDVEIAALQERLRENQQNEEEIINMTLTDLGVTFSNMTPKYAADVLLEMNKTSSSKVLDILKSMDNQARSRIMNALAEANKQLAADISSKLTK